jgi:hypothetical protein
VGSRRRILSSAVVSEAGTITAEAEYASTWARVSSSQVRRTGMPCAARIVLEMRPRGQHVGEAQRRPGEDDPDLGDVPRRAVDVPFQQPGRVIAIALGRLDLSLLSLGQCADRKDQAHRRVVAEAEALHLRSRPSGKVGALLAVVALECEQRELSKAERVRARRGHHTVTRSLLEQGTRSVALAEEVARRALELAIDGAPRAIVAVELAGQRGVVAHASDSAPRDTGTHGRDARLERAGSGSRRRTAQRVGGRRGPVLCEIALAAGQVDVRGDERQRRRARDLLVGEVVQPSPDGGFVALRDVPQEVGP